MAKALVAMLIGFLVGFQGVTPADSSADSLDMGKLYCCRYDCPSRHLRGPGSRLLLHRQNKVFTLGCVRECPSSAEL